MSNDTGILELTLEDVHFFHGELSALIPLELGKVNFLHGHNGAGKSSLFEYLKKNQNSLFKFPVFFISQLELDCLPNMRGEDLRDILSKSFPTRFDSRCFEQIISILDPTLNVLSVEVSNLSGGQAQFIKLAMGLSLKSDFYFIDEPFNNIDQLNRVALREFMINSKAGFLIIDHFHSEWGKGKELGQELSLGFATILEKQKLMITTSKRGSL